MEYVFRTLGLPGKKINLKMLEKGFDEGVSAFCPKDLC